MPSQGEYTRYLSIDVSAAGDTTPIAGKAGGERIRIYHLQLWSLSQNTVTLKDGSTPMNGQGFNLSAGQPFTFSAPQDCPLPLTPGNSFVINLSAAADVSGWLLYSQTS
jgi:hypothetical protein